MFRTYASNSHSYTNLILALGIIREPTVWVCITSQYPGIYDISRASTTAYSGICPAGRAAARNVILTTCHNDVDVQKVILVTDNDGVACRRASTRKPFSRLWRE